MSNLILARTTSYLHRPITIGISLQSSFRTTLRSMVGSMRGITAVLRVSAWSMASFSGSGALAVAMATAGGSVAVGFFFGRLGKKPIIGLRGTPTYGV
jgi:hypothetical protein